jgi:phosphoesterase RecJ-like protein
MTNLSYAQMLEASARFIRTNDDFIVVSHLNPDGDAISSTCAIGWLLSQLGKRYVLVNEDLIPNKFGYMPAAASILRAEDEAYRQALQGAIISVDCADFSRIGAPSQLFKQGVPFLNIDHHPTNDFFGTTQLIQPTAAATAQILYDLIQKFELTLDADCANALYTGLMTDTGGFRYSNTTPQVMQIAADLLVAGAKGAWLAEQLLETMTYSQMDLLKRALNQMAFRANHTIAWIVISLDDIAATNAANSDLEGLVNYARNVEGVEVGLLFKQIAENQYKISFRSSGKIDVAKVAKSLGGGGHHRASGATVQGTLAEILDRVFAAIEGESN